MDHALVRTGSTENARKSHEGGNGGSLVKGLPDTGLSLNNVRVEGGTLIAAGRDVNYHVHYHPPGVPSSEGEDVPSFLSHVPNLRDIQIATLGKATAGTGAWIYVWDDFCMWRDGNGFIKMLWGTGMPGAGKTILASLAINHIEARAQQSRDPICIGYLYIRYSSNTEVTLRDLLEILVRQTVERHPMTVPLCKEVYARHVREKTEPSAQELFGLLKRFTSDLKTFYFLDALDEAPPQVQLQLLEHLSSLNARLFITSRPLKLLENRYPNAHRFEVAAQDRDLETHIIQEISQSPDLQEILATATPGLEGRITLTVKRQCNGMFLHASLHLQALRDCTSRYDLEKALTNFPPQIVDVYAETWNRINNQHSAKADLANKALLWLAYAARALSVDELRYAVAFDGESGTIERTRVVPLEVLVGACCGLLVIESETKIARLIHYTAVPALQTLIVKRRNPHPQTLLAMICMGRLRDANFQNSPMNSREALDAAFHSTPLLHYAYHAWSRHASDSLDDDNSKARVASFLQDCLAFPILPYRQGAFDRFGPLQVAAYFDLPPSLASSFLREPNAPSCKDGLTPLHLASVRNSQRAAKELLSLANIAINASNRRGETPLRLASRHGAELVVELILSYPDTKINQSTKDGATALHAAARAGNTGVVRLLLSDPKIEVNAASTSGTTPLMLASESGNPETVRVLLTRPDIKVNLADKRGNTALFLAVLYARDPDVVKALLEHPKINVDQRDGSGQPAFYYAKRQRWSGSQDVLKALLNAYREPRQTRTDGDHTAGGGGQSSFG